MKVTLLTWTEDSWDQGSSSKFKEHSWEGSGGSYYSKWAVALCYTLFHIRIFISDIFSFITDFCQKSCYELISDLNILMLYIFVVLWTSVYRGLCSHYHVIFMLLSRYYRVIITLLSHYHRCIMQLSSLYNALRFNRCFAYL